MYLIRMTTVKRRNITLSDEAWATAGKIAVDMGLSRSQLIEMLLKYAGATGQMSFSKVIEKVFGDAIEILKKKKQN